MKFKNILILVLMLVPAIHLSCSVQAAVSDKVIKQFSNMTDQSSFFVIQVLRLPESVLVNGRFCNAKIRIVKKRGSVRLDIEPKQNVFINGRFGQISESKFVIGYLIVHGNGPAVQFGSAIGLFIYLAQDSKINIKDNFFMFIERDVIGNRSLAHLVGTHEDVVHKYDLFNENDPEFVFNDLTITAAANYSSQIVYLPSFSSKQRKVIGPGAENSVVECSNKIFNQFLNLTLVFPDRGFELNFLVFEVVHLDEIVSFDGCPYDVQLNSINGMRRIAPQESARVDGRFATISRSKFITGYFITNFNGDLASINELQGLLIYFNLDSTIDVIYNFTTSIKYDIRSGKLFADFSDNEEWESDVCDLFDEAHPETSFNNLIIAAVPVYNPQQDSFARKNFLVQEDLLRNKISFCYKFYFGSEEKK